MQAYKDRQKRDWTVSKPKEIQDQTQQELKVKPREACKNHAYFL